MAKMIRTTWVNKSSIFKNVTTYFDVTSQVQFLQGRVQCFSTQVVIKKCCLLNKSPKPLKKLIKIRYQAFGNHSFRKLET